MRSRADSASNGAVSDSTSPLVSSYLLTHPTAEAKNEKFMAFGDLGEDDEGMDIDADGTVDDFGTDAENVNGEGMSLT